MGGRVNDSAWGAWLVKDLETLRLVRPQTHTLPTVVRMDIMARRVGPGKVGPFPAGGYWWSISQGGMVDDF